MKTLFDSGMRLRVFAGRGAVMDASFIRRPENFRVFISRLSGIWIKFRSRALVFVGFFFFPRRVWESFQRVLKCLSSRDLNAFEAFDIQPILIFSKSSRLFVDLPK